MSISTARPLVAGVDLRPSRRRCLSSCYLNNFRRPAAGGTPGAYHTGAPAFQQTSETSEPLRSRSFRERLRTGKTAQPGR